MQASVHWLRLRLSVAFWDRVHQEYYAGSMVKAHEAWGACRFQCCPNELANVIVDLDDGALNLSTEWLDADKCRRDYLGQDIHRFLTDATNTIYTAFLATLWPTAEANRLSDRDSVFESIVVFFCLSTSHQADTLCALA